MKLTLTIEQVDKILSNRTYNEFLGVPEGPYLDAKSEPYHLTHHDDKDSITRAKIELAKDVAAFANADGGYIIIGLRTRLRLDQSTEEIEDVRPIPQDLFSPKQHRDIVQGWVYPHPTGFTVAFAPSPTDEMRGLGVLFIPRQELSSKPCLVTQTLADQKTTTQLIGYPERRLDSTYHRPVGEIQHNLRIGANIEQAILSRTEQLENQVQRLDERIERLTTLLEERYIPELQEQHALTEQQNNTTNSHRNLPSVPTLVRQFPRS